MNYRLERGKKIERIALAVINNFDPTARLSTRDEDYRLHMDIIGKHCTYDVKSEKYAYINKKKVVVAVLEWHNGRGNEGWLHGESDVIIMQFGNKLKFYNREALKLYVQSDLPDPNTCRSDARLYKQWYNREILPLEKSIYVWESDIEHLVDNIYDISNYL